jgi:hypothetical protein
LQCSVLSLAAAVLLSAFSRATRPGGDLNGDGDGSDLVLHVFEVARGTTLDLGLAAQRLRA